MPYNTVDSRKTALLFFDVLNTYYLDQDRQIHQNLKPVVANHVRLLDLARQANIPVFYAKSGHRADCADAVVRYTDTDYRMEPWEDPEKGHSHPGQHLTAGSWNVEVIDEIKPQPGDYIIVKNRWNAFFQTNLELNLRSRGINTIILCGGSTDVGIASTAYNARDLDFELVIVRDACSANVPENHVVFMDRVFGRMGRVRTTDEVIEMVRRGVEASV